MIYEYFERKLIHWTKIQSIGKASVWICLLLFIIEFLKNWQNQDNEAPQNETSDPNEKRRLTSEWRISFLTFNRIIIKKKGTRIYVDNLVTTKISTSHTKLFNAILNYSNIRINREDSVKLCVLVIFTLTMNGFIVVGAVAVVLLCYTAFTAFSQNTHSLSVSLTQTVC